MNREGVAMKQIASGIKMKACIWKTTRHYNDYEESVIVLH